MFFLIESEAKISAQVLRETCKLHPAGCNPRTASDFSRLRTLYVLSLELDVDVALSELLIDIDGSSNELNGCFTLVFLHFLCFDSDSCVDLILNNSAGDCGIGWSDLHRFTFNYFTVRIANLE